MQKNLEIVKGVEYKKCIIFINLRINMIIYYDNSF